MAVAKRNLQITTPAVGFPVTLEETKVYLRVDIDEDDDLISAFIESATEQVQIFTNRQLITASFDMFLDGFEPRTCTGAIEIPKGNVQTVDQIQYIDSNGDNQIWGTSNFEADTNRQISQFRPANSNAFPSTDDVYNAVTVSFTAGYGLATDVPQAVKQSIFLMVSDAYEHREEQSEIKLENNKTITRLLWNHRLRDFY